MSMVRNRCLKVIKQKSQEHQSDCSSLILGRSLVEHL